MKNLSLTTPSTLECMGMVMIEDMLEPLVHLPLLVILQMLSIMVLLRDAIAAAQSTFDAKQLVTAETNVGKMAFYVTKTSGLSMINSN